LYTFDAGIAACSRPAGAILDFQGVGVGVGLDALTTLKLTVIVAPLVPVPPVELHGVAAKV